MSKFSVVAGKTEYSDELGYELNVKYCADFDTLDEAIEAYCFVRDHEVAFIEYGKWRLEPQLYVIDALCE